MRHAHQMQESIQIVQGLHRGSQEFRFASYLSPLSFVTITLCLSQVSSSMLCLWMDACGHSAPCLCWTTCDHHPRLVWDHSILSLCRTKHVMMHIHAVIIHDWNRRPEYHVILQAFDIVEQQIESTQDGGGGLVVLRAKQPRPNFEYPEWWW